MNKDVLKKNIEEQKEINLKLFKSIPLASHSDPSNEKAELILREWREGSKKLKGLIKELNELEDLERANKRKEINEINKETRTFINGFGEATKRNISCSTYDRQQKKN